jgi:hypothetical protein
MCRVSVPNDPPSVGSIPQWRSAAESFLRAELPAAARPRLTGDPSLWQSPLEGEGSIIIWPFEARLRDDREAESFYVVVGQTAPNYYPAYGLSPEEAFWLHLGTRFMLTVAVARASDADCAGFDAQGAARAIVDRVAPGEVIEDAKVAAAFDAEGQRHVVIACTIAGEPVYVFAGALVPGFSRRRDLPAPVAYRMHLGRLLRAEAASANEED